MNSQVAQLAEDRVAADGRRQRRTQNIGAVVTGFISLLDNGVTHPTRDEVAEQSGVSKRSTYRYFPHDDDLLEAVAQHVISSFWPTLSIPNYGSGALEDRIMLFVASRLDAYGRTNRITRAARAGHALHPAVVAAFDKIRVFARNQLATQFEGELAHLGDAERESALTALHMPFLFDAIDYAHTVHADQPDVVARIMQQHLRATLAALSAHAG